VVGPTQPCDGAQGWVCPTTAPTLGLAYNLAAALSRPRDSLCLVQPVVLAATALAAIPVTRHRSQIATLRSPFSHTHPSHTPQSSIVMPSSAETMRAVLVCDGKGNAGAFFLSDAPRPAPGPGQVVALSA
jgi:hypothetical protein